MLRNQGYEVMPATGGAEALEGVRVQAAGLDPAGLDDAGNGRFGSVPRLKADPATRPIPIIFLTASNEMEHLVKGFEAGAVDYITKPFNAPGVAGARAHASGIAPRPRTVAGDERGKE